MTRLLIPAALLLGLAAAGCASGRPPELDASATPELVTRSHKTRNRTPLVKASGVEGASIAFFRDGAFIGSAIVENGVASFHDPAPQEEGPHFYSAAYERGGAASPEAAPTCTILVDLTAPAPPTNVRTTAYSGVIDVEWDASVSTDVAGYMVYRRTGNGPWTCLHPGHCVLGTKYRDATVTNGVTYSYRVTAVDDSAAE